MLDASLDKLGQFPILQFFGGMLILCAALYAIFRGERDKSKSGAPDVPEQRWYFDGPIAKALSLAEGIYRELKEIRNDNERASTEAKDRDREQIDLLREANDLLRQIGSRKR